MTEPFVHEASLAWHDGDERAPGGAVTEELCGSVDHEPPCPLASHFTSVARRGEVLDVRVLFACEPADEHAVRSLIETALRRWPVIASRSAELRDDEAEHAARLRLS